MLNLPPASWNLKKASDLSESESKGLRTRDEASESCKF